MSDVKEYDDELLQWHADAVAKSSNDRPEGDCPLCMEAHRRGIVGRKEPADG